MNTWTRKSQSVSSCWALNFSNFQFWLMLQGETCKIITLFFKYKTKTAEGKYVLHVLFSDKNLKNKKMLCRTFIYVSEGLIFMYLSLSFISQVAASTRNQRCLMNHHQMIQTMSVVVVEDTKTNVSAQTRMTIQVCDITPYKANSILI